MRILLIYHFFHPDTVISARLFSDLAEDLAASGHQVTVFTSNRLLRAGEELPPQENWKGVQICRFTRPNFRQDSNVGRLLNSLILQHRWLKAFKQRRRDFDAVILGTDPQFCYLMGPKLHRLAPQTKLLHWCFDLYPEAIIASESRWLRLLGTFVKPLASRAYRCMDAMVDLGECMRGRLAAYGHAGSCLTATPWALAESKTVPPADPEMRHKLFRDAKLGILYSGTVGYAHDITPFLELARKCRQRRLPIGFCLAGYGNRYHEQISQVTAEDSNITLVGFADEEELAARLAAADFHAVSLREGWEGIVVPSKFFGALGMGRPVFFSGPENSELNRLIQQYGLGYRVSEDTVAVLEKILQHPEELESLKAHSLAVYQSQFSRRTVVAKWQELLARCAQKEQPKAK